MTVVMLPPSGTAASVDGGLHAPPNDAAASGQFDDATNETDDSAISNVQISNDDDAFVAMMRTRLALSATSGGEIGTARIDEAEVHHDHRKEYDDDGDDDGDYDYEEDDDDLYYDELVDDELHGGGGGGGGSLSAALSAGVGGSSKINFNAKVNLDNLDMSHSAHNSVQKMRALEITKRERHTGRDDRATSEQVLDPRTRLILFKLVSTAFLDKVDGCLSTGKEANVYYARAGKHGMAMSTQIQHAGSKPSRSSTADAPALEPVAEFAVKIFKTSILVFKDRDKYVSGEHRWRRGYCKSNPRKMVKTWAEKELRNYRRIYAANIKCPRPVLLKGHVLVMEFLGKEGWPSPRIRDANLTERRLREAYVQTVSIMRRMFQRCKLVHGDLSEYNLLWHDGEVYVIDVSQSVESDHPSALDFLRKDCANVNDYFRKAGGLDVMSTRQLFEFVTSTVFGDSEEDESDALDSVMKHVHSEVEKMSVQADSVRRDEMHREAVDEAVFMSQFLPRSLNQLAEHEIAKIEDGDVEETYAHAVAALTGNKEVVNAVAEKIGREDVKNNMHTLISANMNDGEEKNEDGTYSGQSIGAVSESDSDGSSDDDAYDEHQDDEEPGEGYVKIPMTPDQLEAAREAKRAERKANKKAVRQEKSEKRQNKIKKKDKRKAIKKTRGNKKK